MARTRKINKERAIRADLERKALYLRQCGATYQEIGDQLGVTDTTAHKWITQQLQSFAAEAKDRGDELRAMEDRRLTDAMQKLLKSDGYRIGDPAAVNSMVKLCESRRRLYGLDMPQKVEHTGKDGQPLEVRFIAPGQYADPQTWQDESS